MAKRSADRSPSRKAKRSGAANANRNALSASPAPGRRRSLWRARRRTSRPRPLCRSMNSPRSSTGPAPRTRPASWRRTRTAAHPCATLSRRLESWQSLAPVAPAGERSSRGSTWGSFGKAKARSARAQAPALAIALGRPQHPPPPNQRLTVASQRCTRLITLWYYRRRPPWRAKPTVVAAMLPCFAFSRFSLRVHPLRLRTVTQFSTSPHFIGAGP